MKLIIVKWIVTTVFFGSLSSASDVKGQPSPNVQHHCPITPEPGIYHDCSEIQTQCHEQPSGIYQIQPEGYSTAFKVYCDFEIDGGGWTVIQRRLDGSVDFRKLWNDYRNGFGFLNTEFWLGNDKLAYLTAQKNYELRIEFRNKYGNPYYAKYNHFRVGDSGAYYSLLLGTYSGNSGADALNIHRNQRFSTRDADHDRYSGNNCAQTQGGGWWFNACDNSNLNGIYGVNDNSGIEWTGLPAGPYELQFTEMKIRPKI